MTKKHKECIIKTRNKSISINKKIKKETSTIKKSNST